jgi:tRNA modification GTPase
MTATHDDTICAIATAPGNGAIAVVRLSGDQSFTITDSLFHAPGGKKKLSEQPANTIHFGSLTFRDTLIDEVLVSIFKGPHSYTGEDVVEISCHGSRYIQQQLLQCLTESGARLANPGEFTMRAFLNGKMDLSQAEAVADLIASESNAAHKMAMNQMRGGFSKEINGLREKLLNFCSLIELELDFSEEDVEFDDRKDLNFLIGKVHATIDHLVASFSFGNVIKNGVPVTIAGRPNVGKSTLLNYFLKEEKAIVSEIAGTTRDTIEDEIIIDGIHFRFIDTAGIRKTSDTIESIGIERTFAKLSQASIIILLADATQTPDDIRNQISEINPTSDQQLLVVINKIDLFDEKEVIGRFGGSEAFLPYPALFLSAKKHLHTDLLTQMLLTTIRKRGDDTSSVIVSNARHYEALVKAQEATDRVIHGLANGITSDFVAMDIRMILHYLGEITGQITTDDVLGNIFSKFCIGK